MEKTDAEIIAEFRGFKLKLLDKDGHKYYDVPKGTYNSQNASMGAWRFHDSWDWFMPLVIVARQKIKEAGWGTPLEKEALSRLRAVTNEIQNINIKNANYAMISFIKWFNSYSPDKQL